MKFLDLKKIRVNKLVRYFILSDLFFLAGWGLVAPIFSLFIVQEIAGATVVTVGIATAIYWILRSVLEVPVAIIIDKTSSERDDYTVLILGLVLTSLAIFSFALVNEIWQLYLVQIIHAIGFALYYPGWYGIFSHHLDRNHRSLEFTLDSTAVGLAAGVTGLVGGILAKVVGYQLLFVLGAALNLVAAGLIFLSPGISFPRHLHRAEEILIRDHSPKNVSK